MKQTWTAKVGKGAAAHAEIHKRGWLMMVIARLERQTQLYAYRNTVSTSF